MGTSANYSAPPNWRNIKNNVTRSGGRVPSPKKAHDFIREHISTNGGSGRMSSGRGQLGNGRTARNTARSFAGFITTVARDGLDTALRENGLKYLIGKSVVEILLGIVSRCGGKEGDIDSVDARNAFSRTMNEICEGASSPNELETILSNLVKDNRFGKLLIQYFGNYLYEQFCRVFFGQLVRKHGDAQASLFLDSIRDVIRSLLIRKTINKDLTKVDWLGREGNQLTITIMESTLAVFE